MPGHTNLLRLAPTPRQHVTDLMERLVAETNSADYGSDLASIGCLIQLLVELNRQAANSAQHHELTDKSGPIVTNVLNYINDHYHEELSLDMLASRCLLYTSGTWGFRWHEAEPRQISGISPGPARRP